MSIENRLAAKERARQVQVKMRRAKMIEFVLILMGIACVGLIVLLIYNNRHKGDIDYKKYITEDGTIEGYDVDANVKLDKDIMGEGGVSYAEYAVSEQKIIDTITANCESALKKEKEEAEAAAKAEEDAAGTDEGADGTEEDADGTNEGADGTDAEEEIKFEYETMFNDEFVEKYFKETLESSEFEATKDGYYAYIKNELETQADNSLDNAIDTWLVENAEVSSLPKKYVKLMTKNITNETINSFETYKQLYEQLGYTSVYSLYRDPEGEKSDKKAFQEAMEKNSKSMVKEIVVLLAEFNKLGLSVSDAEVDEYIDSQCNIDRTKGTITSEEEKMRTEYLDTYGKNYCKMQCKCKKAVTTLRDQIKAAYVPETSAN